MLYLQMLMHILYKKKQCSAGTSLKDAKTLSRNKTNLGATSLVFKL